MAVSDWADLFPHTVVIRHVTAVDAYNVPTTWESAVSYSARVVEKTMRVMSQRQDKKGTETVIDTVVWVAGVPDIEVEDEITLPDGTTPIIERRERIPDEGGAHHVKLYLGRG